jgi:hypothetical protein
MIEESKTMIIILYWNRSSFTEDSLAVEITIDRIRSFLKMEIEKENECILSIEYSWYEFLKLRVMLTVMASVWCVPISNFEIITSFGMIIL